MVIAIDAEPANRDKRTGVENTCFNLIKQFIEIDGGNAEHQYVLYTAGELRGDWPILPSNFKHEVLRWPTKYFWSHIRLSLALRKLKPNVTFIPGNIIPPFAPKPFVTVVHDIVSVEHPELHTGKTAAAHKMALRAAVKRAEVIITPTNVTDGAIKKYFPQARTKVVPLGIDHSVFKPGGNDAEIVRKFGLTKNGYILYVGRFEGKKNTPKLIESFNELKPAGLELVLVGSGDIDIAGAKVLGYQPEQTIAALYRNALVFVFPSAYEGFGLPVLEAMACGCPVITSNLPVLREVGAEAAYYTNPANLTSALSRFLSDSGLQTRLREAGPLQAEKFSWRRTAEAVLGEILKTGSISV